MIECPEELNNQAVKLARDGNFPDAIAFLRRAITLQKNNHLIWYNLGVTCRDSGNLKEAHKALSMAYKIDSSNEDYADALATLCIAMDNNEEAQTIAVEFLDRNPYSARIWNTLGVCFFREENYGSASEYFEQAVLLNPYYEDALYNLRDTYSMLNLKSGEEECEKRLKEIINRS